MEYRVNHNYRTAALGPFAAGSTVDLDDATAAWVNRDSPGCLSLPEAEPEAESEPDVEDKPKARGRR